MTNTNHILIQSMEVSLRAVRSLFKNENLLEILIREQIQELTKIRKKFPVLKREEAIKIAILNSAIKLQNNRFSEKYCLAKVKTKKKNPQLNWLKLHKSFVLDLQNQQASLREIESAIFYRFHHKISHTQIAKFLKIEENNNVL